MPRPFRPRRRGSALVIVLGVLSVLMLMAVAFSTFVRTERGGSTNLKNAFVARSSLDTALGRAMEAIDLSFGAADNNDPVAPWPFPWIASDGGGDHYQSAELGATETAGAHVLTTEISKYLTPAQLALVKSAKCNWAPIYSSINASMASPSRSGRDWGNYGRPVEDSLIGRYAFVALDTTGLLDMNQTGIYPGDRDSNSGDPTTFDPTDADTIDSDGTKIPRFVKSASSFLDKRDSSKKFYSMADAREKCPSSAFNTTVPTAENAYYPADLFAGFAPSLAELDPEGNPKIQLPRRTELSKWQSKDWTALVRRTFRAMIAIFARGRVANNSSATNYGDDQIPIFQNCGAPYQLSRSALATVALLDGLDADFIPGRSTSPTCNYWTYLKGQSANLKAHVKDKNGNTVEVKESVQGDGDPLNYPCTESAPLLSSVFAYITFNGTPATTGTAPNRKKIYSGVLHLGARAVCQNKTTKSSSHTGEVSFEWEVMSGTPTANTITGGNATDIRDGYVEYGGSGGTGGFNPGSGGSGKKIEWKISGSSFFGAKGTSPAVQATVDDDSTSGGSRQILATKDVPFTVECQEDANNSALAPWGGFYPPTQAELNDYADDILVPIKMKVTIKGNGGTVQQVPAPAIASDGQFWLRVSPAVWHGKSSKFGGKKAGSPKGQYGSLGDLSWGWAICAVPAFGFDTSSLVTISSPQNPPGKETPKPSTMGFWVNDIIARNGAGGGGFAPGSGGVNGGRFQLFLTAFYLSSSANAQARSECAGGGFQSSIWNYAQFAWLFSTIENKPYDNVFQWMNKSEGRHVPDLLHCAKSGGPPLVELGEAVNRLPSELYSRIPADGYGNAADLGTVMCGPYETLALFKTWRYKVSGKADFHPVVDYFTTQADRYPSRKEITDAGVDEETGEVDWEALSGDGSSSNPYKDLYSAAHNGRVNLNAPPLVVASKIANNKSVRGKASPYLNPYPIAAVFNGAPYPSVSGSSTTTNTVDETTALVLASDFCHMIEESDSKTMEAESPVFGSTRTVVRDLSFLGAGEEDENTILEHFIALAQPRDDNERESLLRGTIDGFTTRGQTYLLIIRADAYSPRFGENDSVQDGTTLATTHALVELFRDPEPARAPDGSLPSDGDRPVAYHNWYIRSFRVF